MVKAGLYRESLKYNGLGGLAGKPLWLRSADGKGAAEIAALNVGEEALQINGANAVVVEGFKINGGITVQPSTTRAPSSILLQNNIVTNGLVDGITVKSGLNVYLVGNDVSACQAGRDFNF